MMMARCCGLAVACLLSACIDSALVVCKDGRACPASLVCDLVHETCVAQAQLDSCDGLANLEPCAADKLTGVCHDGVCFAVTCGNTLLDPGELCDDGNTRSGDGCAADCTSDETCGNGVLDPQRGENCDDGNLVDHDGCQSTCLVAYCGDGIVDTIAFEQCDDGALNGSADGACRTNCVRAHCGDTIVDASLDEVCDDGNLRAGDGCAPDCNSAEVCGNGITDFATGEQCDDHNLRSHDGCDSRCRPEAPEWTALVQIGQPPRARASGAYDEARRRYVLFGGDDFGIGRWETYEWDGATWLDRTAVFHPPGRVYAAAAYDAERRAVVVFGGRPESALSGMAMSDTWTWDGELWRDASPQVSPPRRSAHSMAYDHKRKRVVMFGGQAGPYLGDTWEWDGANWTLRTSVDAPSARSHTAMAYDPEHGVVVLYGGLNASGTLQDTWAWDGTNWTLLATSGAQPRQRATMSYEPGRGLVLVAGGVADAYAWNGSAWTALGLTSPAFGQSGLSFFDPELNATLFYNHVVNPDNAGLFALRSTVERIPALPVPALRSAAAFAYDARRGVVLMFGGTKTSTLVDELWMLRNERWLQVPRSLPWPSARANAAMTYDASRDRTVMYGDPSDTSVWEWNGASWSSIAATGPGVLTMAELAYHASSATAVLISGRQANGELSPDTWKWDGTQFTDVTTSVTARENPGVVYDIKRDELVMFGGLGASNFLDQTSTWTPNEGWQLQTVPQAPSRRTRPPLGYDARREVSILFGGVGEISNPNDTWVWNGNTWTRIVIATTPSERNGSFAYDAIRGQLIFYGGDTVADATYKLHWSSVTPEEECTSAADVDRDGLAACADPDCAAACTTCGNAVCDPLESCRTCAGDCGTCAARCGNFVCESPETAATCPGDC